MVFPSLKLVCALGDRNRLRQRRQFSHSNERAYAAQGAPEAGKYRERRRQVSCARSGTANARIMGDADVVAAILSAGGRRRDRFGTAVIGLTQPQRAASARAARAARPTRPSARARGRCRRPSTTRAIA
ncbi:hypothetical protein NFJ02_25g58790 [Pycnococcus provasolii]